MISIIISSPIIYLGYIDKANVMDLEVKRCALINENFRLYGSFFSFVIPLIVMILMFTLMVRKLRMQLSKIDNNMQEPSTPTKELEFETLQNDNKKSITNTISTTASSTPTTTNDANISNLIRTSKNPPKIVFNSKLKMKKNESNNSKDNDSIQNSTITNFGYASQNSSSAFKFGSRKNTFDVVSAPNNPDIKNKNSKSKLKGTQIKSQLRRHTARAIIKRPSFNLSKSSSYSNQSNNKCLSKKIVKKRFDLYASTSENTIKIKNSNNNYSLQSSHTEVQNEAKALQVLGIVFIAFIIAWLPFCFINMLSSILEINGIRFGKFYDYIIYFTYLGYFQSTFNPIIYTVFNRKFRRNFLEIIKCKNRKSLKKGRYLDTYR